MIVITLDGTLVVQITEAQIIAHPVRCTRDAGIVVLVETRAEGGILPVVGPASQEVIHHRGSIGIEAHAAGVEAQHRLASLRGLRTVAGPLVLRDAILRQIVEVIIVTCGDTAILAIVAPRAILTIAIRLGLIPVFAISHILAGAEHLAIGSLRISSQVYAHVDDGFALLTLLGGDDDYTACSFCTIDGSRRGILQHVDLLNVVRVDLRETACKLHTIQDDKR